MPSTFDDVAEIISRLPEVTEGERHGNRIWFVDKKGFAWERPFNKADIRRFGEAAVIPPDGPILAAMLADMVEKEAVLAAGTKGLFTMAHFQRSPAVLIQLNKVSKRSLKQAIEDAWLAGAPEKLAESYMAR
jgi:hypothetical protein